MRGNRTSWLAIGVALALVQAAAHAQEPVAQTATTDADRIKRDQAEEEAAKRGLDFDTVIITGVADDARKFDASFAVSTLSDETIDKLAPLNFADLLNQVPGIYAESTGGEVQNVIRVRGIPNESSFQAFHEDGMPVFQDNDGIFFKNEGLIRPDIMTQAVEFVRGGPAPIYASNAAAIYNVITRQGGETPEGAVKVTLGDTGLYRLDGYWAGPVAERTYIAAGGFIRRHEGYRPNGFPNDQGGQFRVNLRHEFDNGEVKAFVKVLDDHNVFYLPIPVADPRNPAVSLDPYIDVFEGTLNTPYLQNAVMLYGQEGTGAQTSETRDLSDGRHMQVFNAGLDYTTRMADWDLSNKFRHMTGTINFDALYSTSNPADSAVFAGGQLAAAQAAFAGTTRLGYAIAGTNGATIYNPLAASGLVIQGQYRAIKTESSSTMNDLRLTREFAFAGEHQFTAGLYLANFGSDFQQRYQDYLFELKSNPRPLDLVAYNAAGAVTGFVTDKGVLRYATTLTGGSSDIFLWAPYIADNWQITDQLRLEAGVRQETYSGTGFGKPTAVANLGNAATLADNATRYFTGTIFRTKLKESVTAWTVGANYDFTDSVGVYARASKAFRTGGEGNLIFGNAAVTNEAQQYELGAKLDTDNLSVFLTGFYTEFDPFIAAFQEVNPQTGATALLNFIGKATSPGVEVDFAWSPLDYFSLDGSVTYNDAKLGDFFNAQGAIAASVEGNQPIRQPKIYGNIRPTLTFDLGDYQTELYARYNFVGDRFVDLQNRTELPAFNTLAAGVTVNTGPWQFQFVGENLTNEVGLTEGNPRADVVAGQGSKTAVYGRPLFGRNFRIEATYRW